MNQDLISRQAAVDAINHICPVDTEYDCTLLDRVDIRRVLSDLPSVQPQRWIPVTERLPEPDERVAVTTGGYEYHVWDCMSNRGDDYFWEDEEGYYHNKYAVDAWMPLPEPYKESEE